MIGQMTDAASANRLQPHKLSVEKLLFLELKNKTLVTAVLNPPLTRARERVFIDNLLARIHLITEMILEDRLCAMGFSTFFFR